MTKRNRYDKNSECLYRGELAEKEFEIIAKNVYNLIVIPATKKQQKLDKFDFICKSRKTNKSYKIEVKAEKKYKRKHKNVSENWLWIEFKGISGYEGWLYGKSDFIAFEKGNEFWIIKRKLLLQIAENLIDLSEKALNSKSSQYKGYRRKQRPHELIAQIKYSDIEKYCKKWQKTLDYYRLFSKKSTECIYYDSKFYFYCFSRFW